MNRILSTLAVAVMACFASAHAGEVYNYTLTPSGHYGDGVGKVEYLSLSYDTDGKLDFEAHLGASDTVAEGGWFVLTPGGLPFGNRYAIMYMDFAGGDVYAYQFDGSLFGLGKDSWKSRWNYLTTYNDVLTTTGGTDGLNVSLSLSDLSALSSYRRGWSGVAFGDYVGAWLHFGVLDAFDVSRSGKLKDFDLGLQSWLDIAYRRTGGSPAAVSEPIGLALLGLLAAGGLVTWRRRQSRQDLTTGDVTVATA